MHCSKRPSFDHLVGKQQERLGDRKTERLCGLEIDDKLELGWRLNRQISAAQNRNV